MQHGPWPMLSSTKLKKKKSKKKNGIFYGRVPGQENCGFDKENYGNCLYMFLCVSVLAA
jgi:hypothetical protein